ncbi:PREDICTED: probable G-protein coupled receptor 139 [Nicrophorus vespilloides]|uniref:Probable G-protein coupled receptor 139 n=1 Tax=Nicrophorus vespilloides TaxID=110193 RepID=A0ABM1MKS5_NICVS|nr:PREDICTED: probable G-protein coupled receptor 139 [Nicrophorus vespilloides]
MEHFKFILNLISKIMENATIYNVTQVEDDKLYNYYNGSELNDTIVNETTKEKCSNCESLLSEIAVIYSKKYHVYVSLIVCIFGTIANILNIIVLTRKEMACAPINRILTGLAIADMLIMVEYIPFAYYYYIVLPGKMNFPYFWAMFMLFHTHFTQILHTISICLTLTLAIWRYFAVRYPNETHIMCTDIRCTLGIILSYILPFLLCIPTYFIFKIESTKILEDKNYILYHVDLSGIAKKNDIFLLVNIWIYSVVIKLLPCCILVVITCWLISTLIAAKKRKELLRNYNMCSMPEGNKKRTKIERRSYRTTKMLIAIVILFIITELPQGIFGLVIGIKGVCFFTKCYQKFGAIMDILALINGSINFILYCWMSRMFRLTFGQLFKPKIIAKWAQTTDECTTFRRTEETSFN